MTMDEWFEQHGQDHDDGEPITACVEEETEFEDTLDYIEAWPDKWFSFAEGNKGEPWLEVVLEKFREYANKPSPKGPAFEEWRKS